MTDRLEPADGWLGETVATPQGDGEFAPDQPLGDAEVESAVEGLQTPPGSGPAGSEGEEHEPRLMERVIDEISRGTLLP
jgi:hypothetical protein